MTAARKPAAPKPVTTAKSTTPDALGLVGVGTMGGALAENLARAGIGIAAFDQDAARVKALTQAVGAVACSDIRSLAAALKRPRAVLMMVNAGQPVDDVLAALLPKLTADDIVIDGGNSHYRDTQRRTQALRARGVHLLGAGISGGEEGARSGASIMVGGPKQAFERIAPLLNAIAARVNDETCVGWFGADGAGHFVKMVHNGIEYAVMQLIAETWMAMERLLKWTPAHAGERFDAWARGEMGSYLIEITAELLQARDRATGKPVVEVIADTAGQKGTGQWTAQAALELGVPAPTLAEAVFARALSANPEQRQALAQGRAAPAAAAHDIEQSLGPALDAATLAAYAQGFALIAAAAKAEKWDCDLAEVARVWRAGCIVRARSLEPMRAAFTMAPDAILLADKAIAQRIAAGTDGLRRVVAAAALGGVAAPCLSSALAYLDASATPRLWTALVQAQRDRFGQHGFERTDRKGRFHLDGGAA